MVLQDEWGVVWWVDGCAEMCCGGEGAVVELVDSDAVVGGVDGLAEGGFESGPGCGGAGDFEDRFLDAVAVAFTDSGDVS